MPKAVRKQLLEIEVMSFLKPYIVQYRIPHFPLLYGFGVCQTSDGNVLHLFMEQLDSDLKSMRGKLTEDQVKSMLLQVLVALYLFHQFGLVHEDMHAGNVMFHRVPKDTCIEYTLPGGRIVIPTYGLFCYIIDYGKVRNVSSASTLDQQDGMQYDVTQILDKLLRDVARTVAITVTADDGLLVLLATYAKDTLFALDTPSFHVPYILDIHAKLFPSPPAPPSQPARGLFAKAPIK
ncbi:haspin protein kinase [Allomyces macrogynus ATCC 38327]|uniref:Haspin protein kinase n=1 Tax=Allomyces macrogynus (strain ATCC 38327) TaxID=578462 RepID=A0A0L0SGG0_ALLM3|nr:haspin protein kinase [Allomyces macrogynus ATCC 38327]|eukprot:KNE61537.1 haspin protein kinase [Allomyces macrogynus ATCC 38327]